MSDGRISPDLSMARRWAAQNLAARLLAHSWTLPSIADSVRSTVPAAHPRTRAALAVRLFALGEDSYPPAPAGLVEFLLRSEFFAPKGVEAAYLEPPVFTPVPGLAGLAIPALATEGELAAWLGLSLGVLDWFSDERHGQDHARTTKLRHYDGIIVPKRSGGSRLIEAPKPRLKAIQRRVLDEILAHVPVHDCAHGFVAGRSCLTGAQIHAGEAVVVCFDLAEFFPSLAAPRVHGLFRSLGYPWAVARRLTGLCTTVTPADTVDRLADASLRSLLRTRHLPQGAPTSPALANLLAWRLDLRLSGIARAAGARYTRYADDLAFSGDAAFARALPGFRAAVARIAGEEGFRINPAKSRVMPRHGRQRITGLVVNQHVNVRRDDVDLLRAILHNCARAGPDGQNRDGVPDFRRHLEGRISWMAQVNPPLGRKLWRLFDRIDWSERADPPNAAANANDAPRSLDTTTPRS